MKTADKHYQLKGTYRLIDDCPWVTLPCLCGCIIEDWGLENTQQKFLEHQFDKELERILQDKKLA